MRKKRKIITQGQACYGIKDSTFKKGKVYSDYAWVKITSGTDKGEFRVIEKVKILDDTSANRRMFPGLKKK